MVLMAYNVIDKIMCGWFSQKNLKKKKQRDALRVQITRVFALTAEHGCFRQSPMTRTDKGEVSPVFLEFIEGIK